MNPRRSLLITSDGTPAGTRIYTEDGEELQGVVELSISFNHNEFVTANLTVIPNVVSIQSAIGAVATECPICKYRIIHSCEPQEGEDDDD